MSHTRDTTDANPHAAKTAGASRATGATSASPSPRPKFILWDAGDGEPRRNDDGSFATDGIIGRVGPDNVYLTAYPRWPVGQSRETLLALEVGQCIRDVFYRLSGETGVYSIYRVE